MASDLTRGYSVTSSPAPFCTWTLIVGAVVGWLASLVMKTNAQMGAIANIVVGIVGSSLGSGWPARSDCHRRPHRGLGGRGAGRDPANPHPEGGRDLQVTRTCPWPRAGTSRRKGSRCSWKQHERPTATVATAPLRALCPIGPRPPPPPRAGPPGAHAVIQVADLARRRERDARFAMLAPIQGALP